MKHSTGVSFVEPSAFCHFCAEWMGNRDMVVHTGVCEREVVHARMSCRCVCVCVCVEYSHTVLCSTECLSHSLCESLDCTDEHLRAHV